MTRHLIAALFALGLAAPVAPVAAQTTAPTDPAAPVVQIDDVSLGNPEAKVQVIEYASYTCPHCADFHAQTLPRLISDYIDTGKIHYIYREIFFDRYGLWAALIAPARSGRGGRPTAPSGQDRRVGRCATGRLFFGYGLRPCTG